MTDLPLVLVLVALDVATLLAAFDHARARRRPPKVGGGINGTVDQFRSEGAAPRRVRAPGSTNIPGLR